MKAGDRIVIIAEPQPDSEDWYMHPDTRELYRKLIARKRSVRIYMKEEVGVGWFNVRFKQPDGTWEHHTMVVFEEHEGIEWRRVKKRIHK